MQDKKPTLETKIYISIYLYTYVCIRAFQNLKDKKSGNQDLTYCPKFF